MTTTRSGGPRPVVIESPFAGDTAENIKYARRAMAHSLSLGEAPIASHLLYTQPGILRDEVAEERERGMAAGFTWGVMADAVAVYADRGVSPGMQRGIDTYADAGLPIEFRFIGRTP